MELPKINKKTILSFFTKQNKDRSDQSEASASGRTSTLPVPTHDERGLPATTVSSHNSSSLITPDTENVSKWPSIWSQDMWERKKEAFPWLDCRNGLLGCTLCSQVSHLGAFKKERTSISKNWCAFTVTYNHTNNQRAI